MATDLDFIEFVYDCIRDTGAIRHKRMFGECMFYCDDRAVILVTNNTAHVKILPETTAIFANFGITPDKAFPYDGAREHYVLDIENTDLAIEIIRTLARILPVPKPKKSKR